MLTLNKIQGFESYSPVILILDDRGKPFYYFENKKGNRITFNLPKGNYTVKDSIISDLKRPLRYVCPLLPLDEKNIPVTQNFDVKIGVNENKASIDTKNGFVLLDEKFINEDKPQLIFIQFHELGHFKYFTEWKCDVFSAAMMLERGYNPTQCYYSSAFCLSQKQEERKNKLLKFLERVKCYE
jgi:hypothetical protein